MSSLVVDHASSEEGWLGMVRCQKERYSCLEFVSVPIVLLIWSVVGKTAIVGAVVYSGTSVVVGATIIRHDRFTS